MNRFDEVNARERKFLTTIPPRSFFRRPQNIDPTTSRSINTRVDQEGPRHASAAPAVATVAGGQFGDVNCGDVNCLAAQAGSGEAGLYKKDDQP